MRRFCTKPQGKKILEAVIASIPETATDLVVSGGSAGALAVLLHIDEVAEMVRHPKPSQNEGKPWEKHGKTLKSIEMSSNIIERSSKDIKRT